MKFSIRHGLAALLGLACGLLAPNATAQFSPLLRLQTLTLIEGGPAHLEFTDDGSGSTNYAVEFSPRLGPTAAWTDLAGAILTDLGGGHYRIAVTNAPAGNGFLRVRGLGGMITAVTASFSTTAFDTTEGRTVAPTITFNAPYYGIVRYTVSGTAPAGDYVSLSGELFVHGTTATIPVTLLDNQTVGQLRYLTLTIEPGPGLQVGANHSATITIDENDAEWQGSFTTEGAAVGFVLKIQESNGVKAASLKSNGLGLFPTNEFPAGLLLTADEFAASVSEIPVAPDATLFNEPMTLSLFLSAMNGSTNQSVGAVEIEGVASLVTVVPAKPFLNTTNFGSFLLLKPAVRASTNQVDLVTAP